MSAAAEPSEVVVSDVPEASRYEARIDDRLVGFVEYRRMRHSVTLIHTEVLPEAEGRGVGSRLARAALDDARARGLRVRVLCPFITAYARRHPEYADMVGPRPAPDPTPPA